MKVDPLLRRAAAALPVDLRSDEPLKIRHAAELWAIAVGQSARNPTEVKTARAAALELSALDDDSLRDAAESLSMPAAAGSAPAARTLLTGLAEELLRLLAARGDLDGVEEASEAAPRRARGPDLVGPPLGDAFRRSFGTWLSWAVFDPYATAQLAWGAAACAADLEARLSDEERRAEAERLQALLARWDTVSLLAVERCTAGSWLESDAMEDALAHAIERIAERLAGPRTGRPPGPRPEILPLPIGNVDWPVGMATRFDTSNTQLQAKRRAERLLEDERPTSSLMVDGKLYPNMASYVVPSTPLPGATAKTSLEDGFGDGAMVTRDGFGRPKAGRPVGYLFKLRQARVIFGYEPESSRWGMVTGYPTDEPVLLR